MHTAVIGAGTHASIVCRAINDCNQTYIRLTYRYGAVPRIDDLSCSSPIDFDSFMASVPNSTLVHAICAIGDNAKRQQIVHEIDAMYRARVKWVSVVHPTAVVDATASLAAGTFIATNAAVRSRCKVGAHAIVNTSACADDGCTIGDFVHCAPGTICCAGVHLQHGVFVGAGVRIIPKCTLRAWTIVSPGSTVIESSPMIPIYKPFILDAHKKAVSEAIDAEWISWQGPAVKACETRLEQLLGVKRVLMTCNGTMACHCLFLALKFKYPRVDKIFVPNSVYVAAWNAALFEYADDSLRLLPIDLTTWNSSSDSIAGLPDDGTAAVLIVHNVGNIVNVPRLQRRRPDLVFLEDACEALFGEYEGRKAGSASFASALSFFANKSVTCGEGGAFATNDVEVADYVWRCCCQGVTERRYIHSILAYNYRITNLQAALLDAQLQDCDMIITLKRAAAQRYRDGTKHIENIVFQAEETGTVNSYWMVALRVIGAPGYEEANTFFKQRFVETRPMFYGMHHHAHLQAIAANAWNKETDADGTADLLSREVIMLPSFPAMKLCEIDYIIDVVIDWARIASRAEPRAASNRCNAVSPGRQ